MGAEAGVEMMPVAGNTDCGIVERWPGSRIEGPRQPVPKQDGAERNPLIAHGTKGHQEEEGVAQSDLRERVFKGEVGLAAVERPEEDAQGNQEQRSPDGVE